MRIDKLVAQDVQTKEKQIFTFGASDSGVAPVTTKGSRLYGYLEFCFTDQAESVMDVEVDFSVDGEKYFLGKYHNDGGIKTLLKKQIDGKWQVVARSKAAEYVENLIGESLTDILKRDYVSNRSVADFDGDLSKLGKIGMLADVERDIAATRAKADELHASALEKVKSYADNQPSAPTAEQTEQLESRLEAIDKQLDVKSAELAELERQSLADTVCDQIGAQLAAAQEKYNALVAKQADIERLRASVRQSDDAQAVLPKIERLKAVAEQRDEFEKKRYAVTAELEWQENELKGIEAELEQKNKQYAACADKRSKLEAINVELEQVASLYENNKRLNAQLIDLAEKEQRLSSEKVLYAARLDGVEKNLAELNQSLSQFKVPNRSVGELLETVRVDVKIDEVTAQIDKLNGEIALKQSKVAQKESELVAELKRFRSVLQLDVAVSPIKAKDTILQVLDAKYSKLQAINSSLEQKLLNLRRAAEDYKYRILQTEQSRATLVARRDKALAVKQEEFKREVYLNAQKVYGDDASGVFAVTANLGDEQIDKLNQQIADRDRQKDELIKKAYALEGAIKEIARHSDVNAAEMATLDKERTNIVNRYNDIIAQNGSEAAFNYVKALAANNGTRYLLETQQEAVRGESELSQEKKSLEALKSKVEALKTRLKYLKDSQVGAESAQTSIDALVSSGDKLKDELSAIGEGLSSGYEQYKALSRQIENVETRLDDVKASIVEISKTIKVNEDLIAQANKRAAAYAGSEDIEQAVQNFKYELGDVDSERQMLVESKQNAEKELFKRRLELEKTQWLYDSKCAEYAELSQDIKLELAVRGISADAIAAVGSARSAEEARRLVAEYDAAKKSLAEKIDGLYSIVKDRKPAASTEDVEQKRAELAALKSRRAELESLRATYMQSFALATEAKAKATVAAAEAKAVDSVKATLSRDKIVELLIRDKVQSVVSLAEKYFRALCGTDCELTTNGYELCVVTDGKQTPYSECEPNVRVAAYLAALLASADSAGGDRWLVLEDRLAVDKAALGQLLSSIGNVSYVVGYTRQTD